LWLLIASQNCGYGQMEDALGLGGDEGRGVPAISCGKVATNLWSADFRMGKPSAT